MKTVYGRQIRLGQRGETDALSANGVVPLRRRLCSLVRFSSLPARVLRYKPSNSDTTSYSTQIYTPMTCRRRPTRSSPSTAQTSRHQYPASTCPGTALRTSQSRKNGATTALNATIDGSRSWLARTPLESRFSSFLSGKSHLYGPCVQHTTPFARAVDDNRCSRLPLQRPARRTPRNRVCAVPVHRHVLAISRLPRHLAECIQSPAPGPNAVEHDRRRLEASRWPCRSEELPL